mmetsp:Transcript_21571/g.27218  ORF Transcript_21571/g.27218 Transcript_21571/m.27218 type:complete len:386 (-) Transcript_21571:160-1317(-)|eukprot:CAMPEP_0203673136 /NCGR_PEP_ID=MMETSP0090-20130426/10952_1 /ASSEMBLY_ACC=CAM_ASM_001088 /TAXON_ID=426623 /ORGANISM="Chaetoceros affinis, Strain CCMP159" /LENGTH=385 /DNA_ID=CAMNT_0050538695 /DNA_START=26 /DNA_END=1183 /DNA_ORIENTATION=-
MSKSPSLRRIQADIRELSIDPSDQYHAAPLENDMFVWHFTIRGAPDTDFEGGIYHGKILLPAEYPFKPPNIMFTTPNGRFETNTKLCLSFSAYHPELWQPAWGIRLILEALISFLPTKGDGAIGALDWTSEERKRLAKESVNYACPMCGNCKELLDRWSERARRNKKKSAAAGGEKSRFQKEIEQLHAMQAATEGEKNDKKSDGQTAAKNDEVKSDTETVTTADKTMEKKEEGVEEKQPDLKVKASAENDAKSEESCVKCDTKNDESVNEIDTEIRSDENQNSSVGKDEKEDEEGNDHNDDNEETKPTETKDENTLIVEKEPHDTDAVPLLEEQQQQEFAESPLLSDPVVHAGIVIFSAIVYLLFRKLQDIVDDLRELEEQFQSS